MVVKTKTKIGPQHQGHKMPLRTFEFAEVEPGYNYELARGFIVVSGIPDFYHGGQVDVIDYCLQVYRASNPGVIYRVCSGADCKLIVDRWESERHPDRAVYLSRPAGKKNDKTWRTWIPDVIVEVVSARSVDRDYVEKREEYWDLGVKEYWIVDAAMGKITQLRRGKSDWLAKELFAGDVVETKLLPGFKLPCQPIFDAAAEHEDDY